MRHAGSHIGRIPKGHSGIWPKRSSEDSLSWPCQLGKGESATIFMPREGAGCIFFQIIHLLCIFLSAILLAMNINNNSTICPTCNNPFVVKRPWQKYCSQKCQVKKWQVAHSKTKQMFLELDPTKEKTGIWYSTFTKDMRFANCVYGFYRNGTYLYVGSASSLCERGFENHHVIGKVFYVYSTDYLNIWLSNDESRKDLEASIILLLKPPFNSVQPDAKSGLSVLPSPDYSVPLALPLCPDCNMFLNPEDYASHPEEQCKLRLKGYRKHLKLNK